MLDPVNPDIHLGLGLLRLESDRLQDAIQCFRRALQHAPAHSLAGLCLAHALYAVGDFPAAAVAFETLAPLSLEATTSDTYVLQPNGRFAHALPHILALAAPSFTILSSPWSTLRLEGRRPVLGHLLTLGQLRLAGAALNAASATPAAAD